MSILILGETICPICQNRINEGDYFYSFPAFVHNIKDRFYSFSDSTFHRRCLEVDKLAMEAKEYAELFLERIKPFNRKSLISNSPITNYEDHIFIEYLTADKNSVLSKFNFSHIDRKDLKNWDFRNKLVDKLIELQCSGEWLEIEGGHYLSNLIKRLGNVSN